MRFLVLFNALLALFTAVVVTGNALTVKKCCGNFRMLSENGRDCVDTDWPQNLSHPFKTEAYHSAPFDLEWVRRWLPPGVPLHSISKVYSNRENFVHERPLPNIARVNSSARFGASPLEIIRGDQVVFFRSINILRPRPKGGFREDFKYCVDAAKPPLGPFALLFKTDCSDEECATKCCFQGEALVNEDGSWVCRSHDQNVWSPYNSSIAKHIDPEFPFNFVSLANRCPRLQVFEHADRSPSFALSSEVQLLFSTRSPCFDYYLKNNTAKEGLFYCEYPRALRGIYWLLRPLCVISFLLLAMALLSIACDKSMRQKIHGWCLAHHAACLLAFNMGQVVYYVALSNIVDGDNEDLPRNLWKICTQFGLCMYFLLTASWFWLTAVCANMALGFRLRGIPTKRSGRKRFIILSALAWGLPALLTITYSFMFTPMEYKFFFDRGDIPWYQPQLMEVRVCFNDNVFSTWDKHVRNKQVQITLKYGTAIFYYCPVACLVLCNCICLGLALTKMQNLRRGNSILRKEERETPEPQLANKTTSAANTDSNSGRTRKPRNAGGSQMAIDAKTIKVYIKMLLMTGIIETANEVIVWGTTEYSQKNLYNKYDYNYPYRASGYVTDFFRAVCVTWLAAPTGGYLGLARKCLRKEKK